MVMLVEVGVVLMVVAGVEGGDVWDGDRIVHGGSGNIHHVTLKWF